MQQEIKSQIKSQVKSISLTNIEQIKLLVIFARSISEGCQKFTIQFLDLVKNQEQSNRGKIALEYYDLLNKYFKYKKIITPRPLCGKLLNNGQFAFKCFQCQNENNSIICIECFNKSDHRGHNYQKIPIIGGCCDCGDDQKWKSSGSCTEHNKKQYDIEVNKEQTEKFIKQMKYVVYLVFVLNFSIFLKYSKLHQISLLEGFITFLSEFNQQSMISNQMTFQLFKSDYTNKYPDVMIDKKKYFLKMNFLSVLTRFYKEKQFSRKLVDLYILMFTRFQFKKYLTCHYNKLVSQKAQAIISQYSNISCQIYTSHRIIQQLLNQKKFPPIQLAQFGPNIKFDVIADSYARFYIDLTYLSQLYNNIGQKYIEHHFSNSSIVELIGYENYVRADFQFCIQYYGIEFIFFHNRAHQFLRLLKNRQVLKKTIKDVVDYLKALSEHQKLSLYISKQRTLCLLLFMYFDGDIGKAVEKIFLDDLGFSYELIFRILQASLNLIRFYAVLLSNRQTVERYYTFYAFSLLKKPRTLVYLDFQLIKFCLLSLQLYSPTQIDLEYSLQKNTSYLMTIPFSQNIMSLQNLIALPVKFLRKVNQTVIDNDDGAYDRKKALGFLSDYIGLMNEIVITNHAQLNLRNLYLENNEKQMIQFYGNLMKSLKSIKPELLKQVSKIIFGDNEPYFVKFIKQYCMIQNKTLKLNPNKEDKFQIVNLSYLKSIKNCQIINEQIHQNNQKYGLQLSPKLLKETHEINELRYLIFNATFINDIVVATHDYLEIFSQNEKILKKDIAIFEKFVEEIIKLNYTLKSNKLESLIKDIQQFSYLFQLISQKNRNQIMKCLGQAKILNENEKKESINEKTEQEKKRMEQLKKKKLQKLKTKQAKALNNHIQCQKSGQKDKMIEQMSQYTPQCMYCKHTAQVQPLFILCFTQKSNLLTKNYLKMNRCVDLITSCNHFVHFSCNKNVNKQRKYLYCNFCKTSSNLLVKVKQYNQQEMNGKLIKSKSMQEKDSSQKLTLLKRMKKIKSSMFDQQNEKSFEQEEQIIEKNQVSETQKKIQVIAYAILYGVIVDYNFFVKSLSNACGFMLKELAAQSSVIKIENLINQLESSRVGIEFTQDEKIYWETYKFSILTVSSLLVVERDHKGWDIREIQQKLPKKIVQNIITLLTSLKSISCMKILQQTKLQPLSAPLLRQLPEKLSELSNQMGQCPNCSRITNQIALCMICDFKSCVSCEVKNLTKHAESHGEASIFIRVDEGLIIYVSILKNRFYIPIYRDFIGNYFILQKNKQDRSDYNLDTNEYQKIRTDIIRHRIQQHIRYEQMATNKYSTTNP